MNKNYIYTGPLSGVSLIGYGDVMLIPGAEVTLPDDHGYTARLKRKGWLTEIASAPAKPIKQKTDPETTNLEN
jgi:hypothetical protein